MLLHRVINMKMENTLKEKVSEWVNTYTDDMYRYAFSQVSNQEMAEDIVQNVFVAAIESLDKLGNVDSPKSWLFSVLRNKISDHHRLSYRNQFDKKSMHINGTEGNHFDKLGDWFADSTVEAWDFDEHSLLDNNEFNSILNSCLEALPSNWNTAIKLKFLEQQEGQKICSTLGISPQNFWQVIHRAKLQLRQCLDNNWFNE